MAIGREAPSEMVNVHVVAAMILPVQTQLTQRSSSLRASTIEEEGILTMRQPTSWRMSSEHFSDSFISYSITISLSFSFAGTPQLGLIMDMHFPIFFLPLFQRPDKKRKKTKKTAFTRAKHGFYIQMTLNDTTKMQIYIYMHAMLLEILGWLFPSPTPFSFLLTLFCSRIHINGSMGHSRQISKT